MTLAHYLCEDAGDHEAAVNIANTIVAEERRPRSQTDESALPSGRPPEDVEISHAHCEQTES